MEDKDRFGAKLHEKGKGDEDQYFARLERERVERLRALHSRGPCPKDQAPLRSAVFHGVTIDTCPTCNGIWLDKGELETLLHQEGEAGITRWVRSLFGR